MASNEEEINDEVWKKFLRKHWKMTIAIIGGIILAAICGFLLFVGFILPNSLPKHLAPKSLSFWSVGIVINFILNVILWEFIGIGIPVIACAAALFLLWWKKLPDEEREEYTGKPKEEERRWQVSSGSGGGAFSFLITLTWLIIIAWENQWDTYFLTWSIEYFVFSWIAAFLWDLLIFGLPMCVAASIWIYREMK